MQLFYVVVGYAFIGSYYFVPLQICSLLLVIYAFSALFESVKQFFYFLSISDFFVGTAVDTAAFKSCI
jgi:hypothetical protein